MAKLVDRDLNWWHRIYIIDVVKGIWVTAVHFFANLAGHVLGLFGIRYGKSRTVTVQYPEEKLPLAPRYRTMHRLTRNPDGSPRCVACYCCESICPADCIYIVAGEYPDKRIEKYPVRFEIDYSKCIWCGLCIESCPEDAIRMDTGIIEVAAYTRKDLFFDKEFLLSQEGRFEKKVQGPGGGER